MKKFILGLIFLLLLITTASTKSFAQTGNCIDSGTGQLYCTGDACPSISHCTPSTHSNVCCTPQAATDPNNDCANTWDFNYNYQCVINTVGINSVSCNWTWQSNSCGAQDRCDTPTGTGQGSDYRVYAGQCNPNYTGNDPAAACTAGGWYKSCCTGGETASNPTPQGTCNVIPLQQDCNPGSPTAPNVTACTIASTPPPPTPIPTIACTGPGQYCSTQVDTCSIAGSTVAGRCSNGNLCCTQPATPTPTPPPFRYLCSGTTCVKDPSGSYSDSTCGGTNCQSSCPSYAPPPTTSSGTCPAGTTCIAQQPSQTVQAGCTPGAQCSPACAFTCRDSVGNTCPATTCSTVWQCINSGSGTVWYNGGQYYYSCPSVCPTAGACTPGQTQTICSQQLSTCHIPGT